MELNSSARTWWWWVVVVCAPSGMCSQTDNLTFVVRDYICSLALKTNGPKEKVTDNGDVLKDNGYSMSK